MSAPLVLVSGAMANRYRNGGEAWTRLNWLLGLRRLGCQVYFIEHVRSETCVDEDGVTTPFEVSANTRFFRHVMRQFGLTESASLLCDGGHLVEGPDMQHVLDVADAADVLINISGHLTLEPILRRVQRKVYVDLDPGFTQYWNVQGHDLGLAQHTLHLTVGENVGSPGCPIPTGSIRWLPTRRFYVPDQWPETRDGDRDRLTTVASWRGGFGPIEHDGRRYGLKVHEFRKILDLPRHIAQTVEVALDIHPADRRDRDALLAHGWHLVSPRTAAGDPLAFRRYVQGSGAECSVAQGIYVENRSGWLSDRTVRYLASGKPTLVQDTGFSVRYPVGEGLVPFRTLPEAVAGAARIARDYSRHAGTARELAETYFSSDVVLPDLLDRLDLEDPLRR